MRISGFRSGGKSFLSVTSIVSWKDVREREREREEREFHFKYKADWFMVT